MKKLVLFCALFGTYVSFGQTDTLINIYGDTTYAQVTDIGPDEVSYRLPEATDLLITRDKDDYEYINFANSNVDDYIAPIYYRKPIKLELRSTVAGWTFDTYHAASLNFGLNVEGMLTSKYGYSISFDSNFESMIGNDVEYGSLSLLGIRRFQSNTSNWSGQIGLGLGYNILNYRDSFYKYTGRFTTLNVEFSTSYTFDWGLEATVRGGYLYDLNDVMGVNFGVGLGYRF